MRAAVGGDVSMINDVEGRRRASVLPPEWREREEEKQGASAHFLAGE